MGKTIMLREGYFRDIDIALMTHANPETNVDVKSLALRSYRVKYHGVSAHAAIKPEDGRLSLIHIFCPQVCTFEEKDNQVILKVREGVTFHDGSPCEIADVEASANRWLNNVKMARTYVGDLMESMKVEGDALVFTFKDPAPLATTMMSGWDRGLYVMPKELCEKYPDSKIADADLIGTGPYKFVEHLADRYIKMEKYQDYKPLESDEMCIRDRFWAAG